MESLRKKQPPPTTTEVVCWLCIAFVINSSSSFAADPFVYYDFQISHIIAAPLGNVQKVIAVNSKFPGPVINLTTNTNVVVNVRNLLDEELLITWPGIQMRRTSWQDGVLGTNCPIPPKWNWTYQFQVKDQIGSYFYFPSLGMQRASGGFGPFVVTNRNIIPIPFNAPDGDIVLMIGDWYNQGYKALRVALDKGKQLGIPDGVLINGKGPYRYNTTLVPEGLDHETIHVDPGKTYRIQVHNVGTSTCLNFRIQNHDLLLVETEGFYTVQQRYDSFDIHVGQSYTFLVTMNQNASSDYYIVASARFVDQTFWGKVTGVAVLHYSNSKGKPKGPLPDPPYDKYDTTFSMRQATSIRQNTTASGARPNPQGSYRYNLVNITDTYKLVTAPPMFIGSKLVATFNGISFINPKTPIRLADVNKVADVYKLDFPTMPLNRPPKRDMSIINATYKGFVEIILQNNDAVPLSFHMDGYSFFVVGMAYGIWTENERSKYNNWDAIARCTVQVFPGGYTAILVSLDNVGVWNLRVENLDRWYLGQETYMRIINPEDKANRTEAPVPDNALYCGALSDKQINQTDQNGSSSVVGQSKVFIAVLGVMFALIFM